MLIQFFQSFVFGLCDAIVCRILFNSLFAVRTKFYKYNKFFVLLLSVLLTFLAIYCDNIYIKIFIDAILIGIVYHNIYDVFLYKTIIGAFIFLAISICIEVPTYIILSLILSPEMEAYLDTNYLASTIIVLLIMLAKLLLVIVISQLIRKQKPLLSLKGWLIFLCLPFFTTFILLLILFQYNNSYPVLISFLLLLANVVCFEYIQEYSMYNRRKKELQQLEERTSLQLETFKDIRSIYNEQQSQIHEFKNYISFIKGLVIEQDYSTLLKYTDSLNERLNLDSSRIKTGNPIIDILLNQTVKKANDNNISLLTNVHIEDPLLIDDNDIIIIISNLLNNALEHCNKLTETNKIINFKLSNDSEQLLIICTNPTESEIKVENNLIETTKKNSLGHGLGLKNIQQIVEKYNGETVISVENNSFKFMIMIHKED